MKLVHRLKLRYLQTQINIGATFSRKWAAQRSFHIFCTPYLSKPYDLSRFSIPPEKITPIYNGIPITGYRWNNGGTKKALLIHGFNSASFKFSHYIQPLIDKGYEVYAFDAPAHGNSGGKLLNAQLYAQFLIQVQQDFGPFDTCIAHSIGALATAIAVATGTGQQETKLVLIAPAADSKYIIETFFNTLRIQSPRLQQEIFNYIKNIAGNPIEWYHLQQHLPEIPSQVLWIHDHDDPITPVKDALALQKNGWEQVQFLLTKGLGHNQIYRDEKVIKTILDFV